MVLEAPVASLTHNLDKALNQRLTGSRKIGKFRTLKGCVVKAPQVHIQNNKIHRQELLIAIIGIIVYILHFAEVKTCDSSNYPNNWSNNKGNDVFSIAWCGVVPNYQHYN